MGGDKDLEIDVRDENDVLVARVSGLLDLSTYPLLRDVLFSCVTAEPIGVVVELGGLTVAPAARLSVFDTIWVSVAQWPGVPVVLATGQEPLLSPAGSNGLPRHVPCYPTTDEALGSIVRPPRGRHVRGRLPASESGVLLAKLIAEQTCLRWRLRTLLDVVPQVAAELVTEVALDAPSGVSLLLRERAGKLAVAVRGPTTVNLERQQAIRMNVATIAGVDFSIGYTSTGNGDTVLWTILDITND